MPILSQPIPGLANTRRLPAVPIIAQNIKDAIRYFRAAADALQTDDVARQYAKNLLSGGRAKDVERLLSLSIDALRRKAPVEQAELPWRLGLAAVRQFYADQQGDDVDLPLSEDHAIETAAQWAMEAAEVAFRNDATNPLKARAYMVAREAYVRLSQPMYEEAAKVAALGQ